MPADVNVTEKVAEVLWGRVMLAVEPEARWADEHPDVARLVRDDARAALAVLSDPEVLAGMAGVLAAHTGWAQVSGDGGEFRLICHDCGEDLGAERTVVAEWVGRTGKDPAEWNKRGRVPAYDEAQAAHQATALADWLRGTADDIVTEYDEEEA